MLLSELQGVKRHYTKTKDQILSLLNRFGIKLVGVGKFGKVLTHPDWNYVIKIFNDQHYLEFVKYVIAHPNKHFPKMQRKPLRMHAFYTRDKNTPGTFWVVKIEKLYEITDKNLLKFIVANLEHAASVAITRQRPSYQPYTNPNYSMLLPDGTHRKGMNFEQLLQAYPWFHSLALAYGEILTNVEGAPDVHPHNFMQRKDGTVVIIDPVWHGETPYQAYDAWLKTETDYYADHEPEIVSGPSYLHRQAKQAPQQPHVSDEDIPF